MVQGNGNQELVDWPKHLNHLVAVFPITLSLITFFLKSKTPVPIRDESRMCSRGTTLVPVKYGRLGQVQSNTCALLNGGRTRRTYSQPRFQLAAPEGFSACWSLPARTIPGIAGRTGKVYSFPSQPFYVNIDRIMPQSGPGVNLPEQLF
jgi:hypothetical protein